MVEQRYDTVGVGYAKRRRPEPTWEAAIWDALGDAEAVLNVGAGTGNYEPPHRRVIAVEPSRVMIAQRAAGAAPVIQGRAEQLPFADERFDAAMGVLTIHHWNDPAAGLVEMRRVSTYQLLVLFEPLQYQHFWLLEYFPSRTHSDVEHRAFATADVEQHWNVVDVRTMWVPADCKEGYAAAYWRYPERYLEPEVQRGISLFTLMDPDLRAEGMTRLASDLDSGAWHDRHAHVLDLDRADFGYRLVVAEG